MAQFRRPSFLMSVMLMWLGRSLLLLGNCLKVVPDALRRLIRDTTLSLVRYQAATRTIRLQQ